VPQSGAALGRKSLFVIVKAPARGIVIRPQAAPRTARPIGRGPDGKVITTVSSNSTSANAHASRNLEGKQDVVAGLASPNMINEPVPRASGKRAGEVVCHDVQCRSALRCRAIKRSQRRSCKPTATFFKSLHGQLSRASEGTRVVFTGLRSITSVSRSGIRPAPGEPGDGESRPRPD
jgi:hypothetical protein